MIFLFAGNFARISVGVGYGNGRCGMFKFLILLLM